MQDFSQTLQKLKNRLRLIEPLVYRQRWELPAFKLHLFPEESQPLPLNEEVALREWPAVEPYTYWGKWNSDFVLITRFALPHEFLSIGNLELYLPLGEAGDFSHPEALMYADGEPFAACDRNHQETVLPALWRDGKEHTLALHGWTGLGGEVGSEPTQLFMRPCQIAAVDQPTRDFVARTRVTLGVVQILDSDNLARFALIHALESAFHVLDTREPLGENFYTSLPDASKLLEEEIVQSGQPLSVKQFATGHAHIDVAWLWPLAVTRQKAARTFTNAVGNLENYPLFHFSQSQPQLYEYIRQDQPQLFERIRQHVQAGRWEVLGGMWLEADCNLSGAESLARQFLLGRSFFEKHFGKGIESPVLWLPDAFGFCWSLPQLIREAGLKYFFTIKLSWNQTNRLPYDTFWWQGLDGSRVLAHFSTTPSRGGEWKASTYNAEVDPGQVLDSWRGFQQKELHPNLLMAYGFGDGGGGPTREMIENLGVLQHFPAMPQVRSGSVKDFFETVEHEDGDKLPTWNGELYLELHRGTYTSQSRNKRANRKAEFALHDAEFLAAMVRTIDLDWPYPYEDLNHAWQLVCLNQFHDILPGSSIGQVYEESQTQYQMVQTLAARICGDALQAIQAKMIRKDTDGEKGLWVVNPIGFKRRDLVFFPEHLPEGKHLERYSGEVIPSQATENGTWLAAGTLSPYSLTALKIKEGREETKLLTSVQAGDRWLENNQLRVELNEAGDVVRIFDKVNQREVLAEGTPGDEFLAYEDRPVNWDAWDIDRSYLDRVSRCEPAKSIRVVEAGPLRATIEVRRRILNSDFVKRISLAYNSARLDFNVSIHWQEKHTLLKTAFPVNVFSPKATYEIQWGNIERPTHENTSWDWARFEVVAHKWVDLSEGDYGVSLLNDCKYGHDIHANVMRLSLLRSPTEPDAHADEGEHTFAYSLYPHTGRWDEHTIAEAYALNDPCRAVPLNGRAEEDDFSLFAVDKPNVVIETVKIAEDGQGWIVRLYESQRCRGKVTLTAGFPLIRAWKANLLEEIQGEVPVELNKVTFSVRPYEIVTLRIL